MKTAFKILMILMVAGILVWSFIGIGDRTEDKICTGFTLSVQDSLNLGLINRDEVLEIIKKKKIVFQGKKISDINLSDVEHTLGKSPYIDTVICNLSANGKVMLTVVPKIPTLHIIANNGEEYYIDRHGEPMPVGNLVENLCIATGTIGKSYARDCLSEVGRCIQDSSFWRAQVQQIDVEGPHDVRLITRFADQVILLGDPTNIAEKLERVRIFYEKGLPKTGWNLYESINVAYDDIIIAKHKEPKKHVVVQQDTIPSSSTPTEQTSDSTNSANKPNSTNSTNSTNKPNSTNSDNSTNKPNSANSTNSANKLNSSNKQITKKQ